MIMVQSGSSYINDNVLIGWLDDTGNPGIRELKVSRGSSVLRWNANP